MYPSDTCSEEQCTVFLLNEVEHQKDILPSGNTEVKYQYCVLCNVFTVHATLEYLVSTLHYRAPVQH